MEISESNSKICLISDFNGSMPGLYKRGLINTTWVSFEGKEVLKVYLTPSGVSFLEEYEKSKKSSKQKNNEKVGKRLAGTHLAVEE